MKVLRRTKVRNISEYARKSVHILCAPKNARHIIARKSSIPHNRSSILGAGGPRFESWYPDITAYWSRHTWATIAASLDIPIETISAALGHFYGSPTTAIYIAFDQRKVDDANRRVIDYVNGYSG